MQAGDGSTAGGLVASNSINNFNCAGCMLGDGSPYFNTAAIFNSHAFGDVTVGATSVAGGFVGAGDGLIAGSTAFGNVPGGGNSVLGGFIGALSFENGAGVILASGAAGSVTSTGPNSIVGGFAGLTGGTIFARFSSGAGHRHQRELSRRLRRSEPRHDRGHRSRRRRDLSPAPAIATSSAALSAPISAASIPPPSAGNATGAANSAVGGFAGANATFVNFPAGSVPGSSFPVGHHH